MPLSPKIILIATVIAWLIAVAAAYRLPARPCLGCAVDCHEGCE